MLIPMAVQVKEYGVRPRRCLHVGAHLAEEAPAYFRAGARDFWWIEANEEKERPLSKALRRARGNHQLTIAAVTSPDKAGKGTLHLADNGQSTSLLEPGTHLVHHDTVHFVGERQVTTTTIDALGGEAFAPDYLALDIQGAELDALRGATDTLASVRWVYSEVNTEAVYKGCALLDEMDAFLGGLGFARMVTSMAGDAGWGDALYTRKVTR